VIGGGFAGRVLRVDLTRGETRSEPLDSALAVKFVGGLGLTAKLAVDATEPGTDALSPDTPIALGAGPLVGTNLPSASRVFAVTKLPTTGLMGWCGGGGASFGYLLKNAGYDHVVIRGRADHPVRLSIAEKEGLNIQRSAAPAPSRSTAMSCKSASRGPKNWTSSVPAASKAAAPNATQ